MKRTGLILLISGFWLLVSGYYTNIYAQDETVEIITYYPAPYGVYQTVQVGQTGHFLTIDYSSVAPIGHRIFSSNTDDIMFSHDGTTNDLVVDTTGRIGIGTNNPTVNLHIRGTGNAILYLQTPGAGTGQIVKYGSSGRLTIGTGGPYNMRLLTSVGGSFQFDEGVNTRMSIASGGDVTIDKNLTVNGEAGKPGGGTWADSSDIRLKKNVKSIENALNKILTLRGITYQWKEPEKHGNMTSTYMGMLAQDVENVFPEWVGDDGNGYKTLGFIGFEALATEAVRELKSEIDALKTKNAELESRIKTLEDMINTK